MFTMRKIISQHVFNKTFSNLYEMTGQRFVLNAPNQFSFLRSIKVILNIHIVYYTPFIINTIIYLLLKTLFNWTAMKIRNIIYILCLNISTKFTKVNYFNSIFDHSELKGSKYQSFPSILLFESFSIYIFLLIFYS